MQLVADPPRAYPFPVWVRFNSLTGVAAYVARKWAEGDGSSTIAFETRLRESEVMAIIDWIETGR